MQLGSELVTPGPRSTIAAPVQLGSELVTPGPRSTIAAPVQLGSELVTPGTRSRQGRAKQAVGLPYTYERRAGLRPARAAPNRRLDSRTRMSVVLGLGVARARARRPILERGGSDHTNQFV